MAKKEKLYDGRVRTPLCPSQSLGMTSLNDTWERRIEGEGGKGWNSVKEEGPRP